MKKIVDVLRGYVRVRVSGAQPEQILNMCTREGIEFWNTVREADGVVLTVYRIGLRRLLSLGRTKRLSVENVRGSGLPFLLAGLRRRYALLGAMLVCLGLAWASSFFIWEIRVSGNERVKTTEILAALDELGVRIGSCRLTISQEYISNEMLLRLPELCWITVNTGGSRAEVLVREDIPAPEILDETAPMTVYAAKSGIIEKITVLDGTPLHAVGDVVLAGEPLVSCRIDSATTAAPRLVHAQAEIYARTWYEMALQMPLTGQRKRYTGETNTKTAIIFAGNRVNLYFNSGNPWACCDKITEEKKLTLFGSVLPITVVRETCSAYTAETYTISEEDARAQLESRLLKMLGEAVGLSGEIRKTDFSASVSDGVMEVILNAECLERIDAKRSATEAETQLPEVQSEENTTYG